MGPASSSLMAPSPAKCSSSQGCPYWCFVARKLASVLRSTVPGTDIRGLGAIDSGLLMPPGPIYQEAQPGQRRHAGLTDKRPHHIQPRKVGCALRAAPGQPPHRPRGQLLAQGLRSQQAHQHTRQTWSVHDLVTVCRVPRQRLQLPQDVAAALARCWVSHCLAAQLIKHILQGRAVSASQGTSLCSDCSLLHPWFAGHHHHGSETATWHCRPAAQISVSCRGTAMLPSFACPDCCPGWPACPAAGHDGVRSQQHTLQQGMTGFY